MFFMTQDCKQSDGFPSLLRKHTIFQIVVIVKYLQERSQICTKIYMYAVVNALFCSQIKAYAENFKKCGQIIFWQMEIHRYRKKTEFLLERRVAILKVWALQKTYTYCEIYMYMYKMFQFNIYLYTCTGITLNTEVPCLASY